MADNVNGTGATPDDVSGGVSRDSAGNLIGNASGASGFVPANDHLLNVDPKLGPLANNGGPTLTYTLLFDSPAIDGGVNDDILNGDTTDQRGQPRIVNVTGSATATVDIGAVELSSLPPDTDSSPSGTATGSLSGAGNGNNLMVSVVFLQASPTSPELVQVVDSSTGNLVLQVPVNQPAFRGGVVTAVGDVNGDGVPDIVLVSRSGRHKGIIMIIDGRTGMVILTLRIADSAVRGPFSVMIQDTRTGFGNIVIMAPHFRRVINLLDPATLTNG